MRKLITCTCPHLNGCPADATQEDFLCDPCREYEKEIRELPKSLMKRTGVHTRLNTGYHGHIKGMTDREMMLIRSRGAYTLMSAGVESAYMAAELDLGNGRDGYVDAWSWNVAGQKIGGQTIVETDV